MYIIVGWDEYLFESVVWSDLKSLEAARELLEQLKLRKIAGHLLYTDLKIYMEVK